MQIDSAEIVIGFCTTVLTVVGILIGRAVKSVDRSLLTLSAKVDASEASAAARYEALLKQDSLILIQLENLRVRVLALEFKVHGPTAHVPPVIP